MIFNDSASQRLEINRAKMSGIADENKASERSKFKVTLRRQSNNLQGRVLVLHAAFRFDTRYPIWLPKPIRKDP